MSSFHVVCAKCWEAIQVPDRFDGLFLVCPKCGGLVDAEGYENSPRVQPTLTQQHRQRRQSPIFAFAVTLLIGLAFGLGIGIWAGEKANQRRVARAQERARELSDALDEANSMLGASPAPSPELEDGKIVRIGREDIASPQGGMGVSRDAIVRAVKRIYTIEAAPDQRADSFTFLVPADGSAVQIVGAASAPHQLTILIPQIGIEQLSARLIVDIARLVFRDSDAFLDWLEHAELKVAPGFSVMGEMEGLLLALTQKRVSDYTVLILEIASQE